MWLSVSTGQRLIALTIVTFVTCASSTIALPNVGGSQSYAKNILPRLSWLRDATIEWVFGSPSSAASTFNGAAGHLRSSKKQRLPGTLLAQYGEDLVLRFNLTSGEEEMALAEAADMLFLDVWEFTNHWADIRLREADIPSLLGLLPESMQKSCTNLMPDLARAIHRSYPSNALDDLSILPNRREPAFTPILRINEPHTENVFFSEYQPMSVIVPWMRLMASMFSTHVQMISIGTSYEGRDIPALKVGSSSAAAKKDRARKTILVSGGTHAREWISTSTVLYAAWSFITSYGKNDAVKSLLEAFDFVFIPTINVDGYVYTWEHDRLWRKSRQTTSLRFCRGFDLDRTFGYRWDGTSFESNPCSESYPGEESFQATESNMLASWARNQTDIGAVRFVGFLDMHSYSQQLLYPYSYTCGKKPPSLENLEELALGMVKAIRLASGEQYAVTSACEGAVPFRANVKPSRMEAAGGSALDWFYHEMHVRYSYQLKLRDTGSYGFLLPKENIVPTGEEALSAIKYFGDFLLGNKGIEGSDDESTDSDDSAEVATSLKKGDFADTHSEHDVEMEINTELRRKLRL